MINTENQTVKKEIMEKFKNHEELTKEERLLSDIGDIRINRIQCLLCKDTITSLTRHDFVVCKCGKSFVDGGSWYQRSGGDKIKDLTVYYKDL